MTHSRPYPNADLQEVLSRNHTAHHLLTALIRSTPAYAPIWEQMSAALADSRTLINELTHIRADLARARHKRANLLAAAQATLAAAADGESDPLFYVRDEIDAQRTYPRQAGGGVR